MSVDAGELATDRARVKLLRSRLGARLAMCRMAAGLSQAELGQALGRTRSTISKIEHGERGMPAALWKIADNLCGAEGVLIAEHSQLAQAEQDYHAWCRLRDRQVRQRAAQAQAESLPAQPALLSCAVPQRDQLGGDACLDTALVHGQLAEELMAMVTRLIRSIGRRNAMRMASGVLAAMGLSGLDAEEYTRVAQAVAAPYRVDAHVVHNLAATLAQCKHLEDKLGCCAVFDTVMAQHGLVRRLLEGGCPDRFVKPLQLIESNMASTIGAYLVDMGRPEAAIGYFQRARRTGHDAGNPACAAYAAAWTVNAAFLRGDTPTALDMAAAARNLAARTNDPRLKALAEHMAAAAYALDGQHNPYMAASARAQELLATANGSTPDSLAYWVQQGTLDSQRCLCLCLLNKPKQAIEAATNAHNRFTNVGSSIRCQIRLGHALVLDKEITEAAHILGQAAPRANLNPRLAQELHTTRALMQPWANTPAVKALDTQLDAHGLRRPR